MASPRTRQRSSILFFSWRDQFLKGPYAKGSLFRFGGYSLRLSVRSGAGSDFTLNLSFGRQAHAGHAIFGGAGPTGSNAQYCPDPQRRHGSGGPARALLYGADAAHASAGGDLSAGLAE